jgi:hypothetical protein
MATYINTTGTSLTLSSLEICLTSLDFNLFTLSPKIDTTCFGNSEWKTAIPSQLADVEDISFGFNLESFQVASFILEKGVNQLVTITLVSDTTNTITFWGYLSALSVSAGEVDGLVTGTGTIVITNVNGSSDEEGPTYA